MLHHILLWLHLISILGTFGGLLFVQTTMPAEVRLSFSMASRVARIANVLIGLALLTGLGLYFLAGGPSQGGHFNGVIGTKFAILLAVGALLAMSKKSTHADVLRNTSMALIALAAFLGVSL